MKGGNNIEENTKTKYVVSCSFGKDSIATILLALENNEPLDEIVYCKVIFDKTTSGEVPEHEDFIQTKAIPFMEKNGLKVKILCREDENYVSCFTRKIKRGRCQGMLRSFPLCGRCCIQRDLKLPPILKYQKSLAENTKSYVGIAYDEQERLLRLKAGSVSLLEKYHFTEEDAKKKCIEYGLLSPIYEFSNRGGVGSVQTQRKKSLGIYTITIKIYGIRC